MLLCLSLVVDVERNVVKITDARMRGLGDGERELAKAGAEKSEEGWAITPEGVAELATATPTPAPGNLMAGVPKPAKPVPVAIQAGLAGDMMLLGLDEDTVAGILKAHSLDRLRKLLTWVRTVQGREGVSRPDTLFLKCLSKGVQ